MTVRKNIFRILWAILALGVLPLHAAFEVDSWVNSGEFDFESDPPFDNGDIRNIGGRIEYIANNSWVVYSNFNFGVETTYFTIEIAQPANKTGTLWVYLDSLSSSPIGSITASDTGGYQEYAPFELSLTDQPISGTHDLYFLFVGDWGMFNTRQFQFYSIAPGTRAQGLEISSADFDLAGGGPTANPADGTVEFIDDESWVAYTNFNFGAEANRFTIQASTPGSGGRIELRIGSETGPIIGSTDIAHTGSWGHYKPFDCVFPESVSGTNDLYLTFIDSNSSGGNLFNIKTFLIEREVPALSLPVDTDEDLDGISALGEYATGMHPQSRDALPFGFEVGTTGALSLEVRVREDKVLRTLLKVTDDLTAESWEEVTLIYTNAGWQTDNADFTVSEAASVGDDLYTVRIEKAGTDQNLFFALATELQEGDLHVYDPVPGGADLTSPYYSFQVQKVSQLNAATLADVTNWEEPFAFFTKCLDHDPDVNIAYYTGAIGGWSHTYCNFELDPHTPIVVKIHRYTEAELSARGITTTAPLGPITRAAPHPARKVDSCEIINGDVYVTLSQPALVSVDIDGQMDLRDLPRSSSSGFSFQFNNEADGCHGVSIFANPFIEGKPDLSDPTVFAVEPGTLPPETGSWTTLYFKPGIHKFSVDNQGNEREWIVDDVLDLQNDKNYYIPGDAIVYGNMNDLADNDISENIHIFGHGTLCGSKIPHFSDFVGTPPANNEYLHAIGNREARNVVLEGITVADPPEHGITFRNASDTTTPNYIKWMKNISWRRNNDAIGNGSNGYVENCFFRHQDDGIYVGGLGVRDCVFWMDVNGIAFRTSFITSNKDGDEYKLHPFLIFEDCDIIYSRGIFNTALEGEQPKNPVAVIGSKGTGANKTYSDGTTNTAQHVIFRNIRYSDPRPGRNLIGIVPDGDLKGIRFENCVQDYPQVWGWKDGLVATNSVIQYCTLDNVYIAGEKVDEAFINNTNKMITVGVSDMIIK